MARRRSAKTSSKPLSSKRRDGTRLVTHAIGHWLWRKGARAIAWEVGLHKSQGLTCPWHGHWRVDLAACVGSESIHVVEVKGSKEDLSRENLGSGKWQVDFPALGITPWLAVVEGLESALSAPVGWGVLSVSPDGLVREIRSQKTKARPSELDFFRANSALAQVLTAQYMPTLFSVDAAVAIDMMSEVGVDRPWRLWSPTSRVRRLSSFVDEDVNFD
jgi:hypothetical protein